MESKNFSDFNLIEPLNKALRDVGYVTPTPVQVQSIPPLLEGRDLLGCAQTGTGKTAAFALPILQRLANNKRRKERWSVRALIVTPTRELAAQIDQSMRSYAKHLDITGAVIYGGVGQSPQVKAMDRGVDILVATPGRLLDLINQGYVRLESVEIFVLDEADRMLDMGFLPDIKRLLAILPRKRQTMFFSATLPPDIVKLANTMVVNPISVNVTPDVPVVELIDQKMMFVERQDKVLLLEKLLQGNTVKRALVFSRTKHGANKIVRLLERQGIRAQGIHGNKAQTARTKALEDFRSGRVRVLVATDIAARGIDVEGISHVINFDIPNIPETYIHRIGRTARAGLSGVAISFCDREERSFVRDIERLLKKPIPVLKDHPFHSEAASVSTAPPPPQGGRGGGRREFHGGGGPRGRPGGGQYGGQRSGPREGVGGGQGGARGRTFSRYPPARREKPSSGGRERRRYSN
ncbi:MAG: DEAD/DEAH box helicase [Methanobacteriota archaeon]